MRAVVHIPKNAGQVIGCLGCDVVEINAVTGIEFRGLSCGSNPRP